MKLVRCNKCRDIVALHFVRRYCDCGASGGRYLSDGLFAEFWGPATPLGFANGSFKAALENQPEHAPGQPFTAFVIEKNCRTFTKVEDDSKYFQPVTKVN